MDETPAAKTEAPKTEVPPVVRDVVHASLSETTSSNHDPTSTFGFSFAAAVDKWHGGQTELGVDARLVFWALPRFGVTARAGYRIAQTRAGDHGDIASDVLLGGLGVAFSIVPRASTFGVAALSRIDLLRVQFLPRATTDVRTHDDRALTAAVSLGLDSWVRLGRVLRLDAELTVGAPFRSISAADEGRIVTAVSGAQLGFALAIGGEL